MPNNLFVVAALVVAQLCGLCSAFAENSFVAVEVRYNATQGRFSATEGPTFGPVAANVSTNFTFYTTGWDVVMASGNDAFMSMSEENRLLGYRAAGFGEGYLNYLRIFQNYNNSFFGEEGITSMLLSSPEIVPWIDRHYAYLRNRSKVLDSTGRMLGGLLALMDGLADGYAASNTNPDMALNATQFFWISFQAEVGDIISAYSTEVDIGLWKSMPSLDPRRPARHCSALVKILSDDVYFSHVTWSSFNSMMRQYKTYKFEDRAVTMSGYPGVIHSIDDWYMTSNRLAVMETTNGVNNMSLFREFVKPGTDTISEFLRVMIANFLAPDAASWVSMFSNENSGTYNNQWMIFDMKRFTPGSPIPSGTFWVAEQLPGSEYPYGVTSADKSEHLNENLYWASYNIPYFPNVYDVSGNLELFLADGDFFSYTNYSRAEIFRRNHTDVVDLSSMKAMMRYNNFKHDPLSLITNCKAATNGVCNPPYSAMLSIASRGDLNPVGGAAEYGVNYQYLTRRNHCGTDVKIATWSLMMNNTNESTLTGVVINGPTTYNNQPVFQWSASPFSTNANIVRQGLPDIFDFSFAEYSVVVPPATVPTSGSSSDSHGLAIGLGVGGAAVVAIVVIALVVKSRKVSMDASEQVNLVDRV